MTGRVMDRAGWDLVEVNPEKVAGQPVVKPTRVPADVVLIDQAYRRTPEQTRASSQSLKLQTICNLLAFAHSQAQAVTGTAVGQSRSYSGGSTAGTVDMTRRNFS
jgi:uncharacterized protein (DUF433 family)